MALSLEDMLRLDREASGAPPGDAPAPPPAPRLDLATMERLDREAASAELPARGPDVVERVRQFNRGVLDLPEAALRLGEAALGPLSRLQPPGVSLGVFDAPVSAFRAGAAALTLAGGKQGADALAKGARDLGVIPEKGQEEPDLAARLLRNAGAAAVPTVGALRGATSALGAAGILGREAVSTVGATAGGVVTEAVAGGDNLVARAIGELIGGVAAPLALGAGPRLAARAARNVRDSVYDPNRPARRLQSLAADPAEAARRAEAPLDPTAEALSPAQRTGDPGLLSLEASAAQQDPALAARLQDRMAEAAEAGQRTARMGGDPEAPSTFLQNLTATAAQEAQDALRRLDPGTEPRVLAERTRTIIDGALKAARDAEDELYRALPRDTTVVPERAVAALQDVLAQRTEVDAASEIPRFVRKFLGDVGEEGFAPGTLAEGADFARLHTLRSRILQEARKERGAAAPNGRKLSILTKLQEALLDDLDAVAQGQFREATAFSRELNDRFTRGAVGELLSYDVRGGRMTAEAETLERVLGGRGQAQAQQFRELVAAAPESRAFVEDHLRTAFLASATDPRTGVVSRPRAEQFLRRNQGVLDELPDVRRQLTEVMGRQGRVDELLGVPEANALTPLLRRKSAAGLYLDGNPDQAIERVMRTGDPALARSLVREVSADPSGTALQGLKASFVDALFRQARQASNDIRGNPVVSGARLRRALDDNERFAVAFLDPGERRRLNGIVQTFELLDRARRASPRTEGVIADTPSQVVSILARAASSSVARRVFDTLQATNIVSADVRRRIENFTNDPARSVLIEAVEDPALYAALLRRVDQVPERAWRLLDRVTRPYQAIPVATLGREDEDSQAP